MAGVQSTKVQRLCQVGVALGLANYVLFAVGTNLFGDAISGHIAGIRYFLHFGDGFSEVSRFVFQISEYQSYSLLITFPIGLLCAYLLAPPAPTGDPLDADKMRSLAIRRTN